MKITFSATQQEKEIQDNCSVWPTEQRNIWQLYEEDVQTNTPAVIELGNRVSEGNKPTTSYLGMIRTNCLHRREGDQVKYSRGQEGGWANLLRPSLQPTTRQNENVWVGVCASGMFCAHVLTEKETMDMRQPWKLASFPEASQDFKDFFSCLVGERTGWRNHPSHDGKNGKDALARLAWFSLYQEISNMRLVVQVNFSMFMERVYVGIKTCLKAFVVAFSH